MREVGILISESKMNSAKSMHLRMDGIETGRLPRKRTEGLLLGHMSLFIREINLQKLLAFILVT